MAQGMNGPVGGERMDYPIEVGKQVLQAQVVYRGDSVGEVYGLRGANASISSSRNYSRFGGDDGAGERDPEGGGENNEPRCSKYHLLPVVVDSLEQVSTIDPTLIECPSFLMQHPGAGSLPHDAEAVELVVAYELQRGRGLTGFLYLR
ncbi:hypothetical protein Salat_1148500 [Sesamum alatum]|uniref:Uncharacterized protein n=1 Tax=Sesamum alatum TaxID=300844 RepID=A0AAE1YEA0_9LAMI|nr:hypothetical protein Salat_1148500 [Sesamum alatum]